MVEFRDRPEGIAALARLEEVPGGLKVTLPFTQPLPQALDPRRGRRPHVQEAYALDLEQMRERHHAKATPADGPAVRQPPPLAANFPSNRRVSGFAVKTSWPITA